MKEEYKTALQIYIGLIIINALMCFGLYRCIPTGLSEPSIVVFTRLFFILLALITVFVAIGSQAAIIDNKQYLKEDKCRLRAIEELNYFLNYNESQNECSQNSHQIPQV